MSDLKTPEEVTDYIRRRLNRHWHTDLTGDTDAFPHRVNLGHPTRQELEADWTRFHDQSVRWHDWAHAVGASLATKERTVHRTRQAIPEHLTVPDLDTAATISGDEWVQRLARNRGRLTILGDRFPHVEAASALRVTDKYTDDDFDTLLSTADWFNDNPGAAEGLTPRMVPLPGVHAKWLQDHRNGIAALTGVTIDDLIRHPPRINFTYLDPDHRAAGGRHHDSATIGDPFTPACTPIVVLISENKDTAIRFPPIPGGIAVEGGGFGGSTAAAFAWLTTAPHLYYWGDIDAHGYEILNGFRTAGVPVTSILMAPDTYDAYERFGTNMDAKGNVLHPGAPKPLPHLTNAERVAYHRLTDPAWTGHRRIEQERIPLQVAVDAVIAAMRTHSPAGA